MYSVLVAGMAKRERESFKLLQLSDSASDSLPDLDLVIPASRKSKKKVRLKRRERAGLRSSSSNLGSLKEDWARYVLGCCSNTYYLVVLVSFLLVAVVSLAYFTASLYTRLDVLTRQMKAVDDDSKAIPDSLQQIHTKLERLHVNQSQVLDSLADLERRVGVLTGRLEAINSSLQREGSSDSVRQTVADLGASVRELRQGVETVTNTSAGNADAIKKIGLEVNRLKLTDVDSVSRLSTRPPVSLQTDQYAEQLKQLGAGLTVRLDRLNTTLSGFVANSSHRFDWLNKDVASLQGRVDQLGDDNHNLSSQVLGVRDQCAAQFRIASANVSGLAASVQQLDNRLASLERSVDSAAAAGGPAYDSVKATDKARRDRRSAVRRRRKQRSLLADTRGKT